MASRKSRSKRGAARRKNVARARRSSNRSTWIVGTVVVVIGVALIIAARSGGTASADRSPAPAALVAKVVSVPPSVFDAVGAGSASPLPTRIAGTALVTDGKPRIVFMGAEYCPYCAAERWAVIAALARFGTWSGLERTHSSSFDTLPDTQTFSLANARFHSAYVSFEAVEMNTNQLGSDGGYKKFQTPTVEQQQLMATYDAPPYVSSKAGGIPFIDFGGRYVISGATYDAGVLHGLSAERIASDLADPTSQVSQGAIGAANGITAATCELTHNQPSSVCGSSAIQGLETKLA